MSTEKPQADPNDGAAPDAVRITTGDVNRLTTRAERESATTAAEIFALVRERKAGDQANTRDARDAREAWPHGDGTPLGHPVVPVVPRSGLHDGQDPADVFPQADEVKAGLGLSDPGILERNGYAAVRTAMLGVCQALGAIPREAVDAAIAYNAAAARRLKLDAGDPRAAEALKAAEREARYLETVQRMHRDLRELEQRMAAGDRITAR